MSAYCCDKTIVIRLRSCSGAFFVYGERKVQKTYQDINISQCEKCTEKFAGADKQKNKEKPYWKQL